MRCAGMHGLFPEQTVPAGVPRLRPARPDGLWMHAVGRQLPGQLARPVRVPPAARTPGLPRALRGGRRMPRTRSRKDRAEAVRVARALTPGLPARAPAGPSAIPRRSAAGSHGTRQSQTAAGAAATAGRSRPRSAAQRSTPRAPAPGGPRPPCSCPPGSAAPSRSRGRSRHAPAPRSTPSPVQLGPRARASACEPSRSASLGRLAPLSHPEAPVLKVRGRQLRQLQRSSSEEDGQRTPPARIESSGEVVSSCAHALRVA
jgi:hypothetical protein